MRKITSYSVLMLIFLIAKSPVLHAQPNAYFTADTNRINTLEVYVSSTYHDQDTVNYTFSWDFGDGSYGSRPSIAHLYQQSGTYTITLRVDSASDSDSFSMDITVKDELYVPNVFTPNKDGINDFFIIRTNGVKEYSLTIFTKSGYQITSLKGTSLVWDGKMASGKTANPGIYYYVLSDKYGIVKKGFFHLFD